MENFENVCSSCGAKKNDALLTGSGNLCRCSDSYHHELGPCNISGMYMVGEARELTPSFCCQRAALGHGECSKTPDRGDSKGQLKLSEQCATVAGIHEVECAKPQGKAGSNAKLQNEPKQDPTFEDGIGAQGSACYTNEGREPTSGQAKINNDSPQLLLEKLKKHCSDSPQQSPEICQILSILCQIIPGGEHQSEIISSEKVVATGTSSTSETRGGRVHDTHAKMLESKVADLERKVSQHDSLFRENNHFRQRIVDEVMHQRKSLERLHLDLHKLKIEYEALKNNFMQVHAKITRLRETTGQITLEIGVLKGEIELNKQSNENLVRRLNDMNEKVTAYVNLVCGMDIQSVE